MGHVVVSMDSHTELIVDLKPYLAEKNQDEFDRGARQTEELFRGIIDGQSDELRAIRAKALGTFSYPEEMSRPFVMEEYAQPRPMYERLRAIDADGVAAEFITP